MPLFCVAVPVRGLRLLLFVSALSANVSARRLNILARCGGAVLRADTQKESAFGESFFFLSEEFFVLPYFFCFAKTKDGKAKRRGKEKKQKKEDHTKMNKNLGGPPLKIRDDDDDDDDEDFEKSGKDSELEEEEEEEEEEARF